MKDLKFQTAEQTMKHSNVKGGGDSDFYTNMNKGFAMAINARECKFGRYFNANPLVTTTILINHLKAAIFQGDGYAWERIKRAFLGVIE